MSYKHTLNVVHTYHNQQCISSGFLGYTPLLDAPFYLVLSPRQPWRQAELVPWPSLFCAEVAEVPSVALSPWHLQSTCIMKDQAGGILLTNTNGLPWNAHFRCQSSGLCQDWSRAKTWRSGISAVRIVGWESCSVRCELDPYLLTCHDLRPWAFPSLEDHLLRPSLC